ncbi:MAG: nitrogen fixation protein NifQ [Ancalomicrobiaceae bacterium]|nr:nitrogen fixation protein NifQ [Ancalomicrobiaceae bacterium]
MSDVSDHRFASHYATLSAAGWPALNEAAAFEIHVFASALAVGMTERDATGLTLRETTGLTDEELTRLMVRAFPLVQPASLIGEPGPDPLVDEEEALVRDLLVDHRADARPATRFLAAIVARRAMRDDHLWQDLGLANRSELSRLLSTYFPRLAAGNTRNMRWKKYFYRTLCEAEGFSLCTAPSCSVCSDFVSCFGEEDGMSRLATARRTIDGRRTLVGGAAITYAA